MSVESAAAGLAGGLGTAGPVAGGGCCGGDAASGGVVVSTASGTTQAPPRDGIVLLC